MYRSVRESLAGVGRWPRLLAVTACLLLAAVSAVDAARHSGSAPAHAATRTVPVVVAAHDLPAGRLLAGHDLTVRRWPVGLEPVGAAGRVRVRVGERLAGPLRAGEAVTGTRLIGSALTDGLDPGLAAVPVSVPDPHAAELIRPGEHVELLATPNDDLGLDPAGTDGAGAQPGSVTVVARRLLVLAVLAGRQDESTSLVVAADPTTTIAIAQAESVGVFLAVPVAP